ncbi:hypothetical protein FRB95_002694 [Tulasnella sp. JGI-2019a]|nr:hypothetical protein FRB95_002694 [Tulasnella sp. JGI-2019a]
MRLDPKGYPPQPPIPLQHLPVHPAPPTPPACPQQPPADVDNKLSSDWEDDKNLTGRPRTVITPPRPLPNPPGHEHIHGPQVQARELVIGQVGTVPVNPRLQQPIPTPAPQQYPPRGDHTINYRVLNKGPLYRPRIPGVN